MKTAFKWLLIALVASGFYYWLFAVPLFNAIATFFIDRYPNDPIPFLIIAGGLAYTWPISVILGTARAFWDKLEFVKLIR